MDKDQLLSPALIFIFISSIGCKKEGELSEIKGAALFLALRHVLTRLSQTEGPMPHILEL